MEWSFSETNRPQAVNFVLHLTVLQMHVRHAPSHLKKQTLLPLFKSVFNLIPKGN